MSPTQRSSLARRALFVALALVVAAAGLMLGSALRGRFGRAPLDEAATMTGSLLEIGTPLPDVALVREDGTACGTRALIEETGAVFLFVELGCPPCSVMTERWQRVVDDGELPGVPVVGIAAEPVVRIRSFKAAHGVTLPIYSDGGGVFERDYRVNAFPLNVIVGPSGLVRATTYDANAPIDPARVASLLAE